MEFYQHLQEMVREFGVNELAEFESDRKLQSALLLIYIDHNWDEYYDIMTDVQLDHKAAIRERIRAHADSSPRIDQILDNSLAATFNYDVIKRIVADFEGYWLSGDDDEVLPFADYEWRLRTSCTGECGLCLRCMNTEARVSEYQSEVA